MVKVGTGQRSESWRPCFMAFHLCRDQIDNLYADKTEQAKASSVENCIVLTEEGAGQEPVVEIK